MFIRGVPTSPALIIPHCLPWMAIPNGCIPPALIDSGGTQSLSLLWGNFLRQGRNIYIYFFSYYYLKIFIKAEKSNKEIIPERHAWTFSSLQREIPYSSSGRCQGEGHWLGIRQPIARFATTGQVPFASRHVCPMWPPSCRHALVWRGSWAGQGNFSLLSVRPYFLPRRQAVCVSSCPCPHTVNLKGVSIWE